MMKKRPVSGLGPRIGRFSAALVLLWAILAASVAVGGESIPEGVDPVTEGLVGVWKIIPANPDDFTFAVIGDNQASISVFPRLLAQISADPDILFAVSTGDTVIDGTERLFDFFFSQVSRHLTKPLVLTASNHELSRGAAAYESIVGRRNYSFTFGDAYFIVLDDSGAGRMDSIFEEWLTKELDAADPYAATLVFMHVPLYDPPDSGIQHSLGEKAAERLMAIFRGRRITHIFCSHIHGYFTGDWEGIPYTISGGGGAHLVGSDPAHFYYHYLKVRVKDGVVTYEPVRLRPSGR
jgi:serine/threonine-protein phosphatase CPPED1